MHATAGWGRGMRRRSRAGAQSCGTFLISATRSPFGHRHQLFAFSASVLLWNSRQACSGVGGAPIRLRVYYLLKRDLHGRLCDGNGRRSRRSSRSRRREVVGISRNRTCRRSIIESSVGISTLELNNGTSGNEDRKSLLWGSGGKE